ncbi:frizzled-5 [Pimephales promelas]|nr:frizzled-5 [Pimephales promelas]
MECYLLGIYLFLALALLPRSSGTTAKEITCQEIAVPLCKGIGYNYTYMPNQFNHDTQDEAGLEVHQFWPLVEIQCSPDLKFFLCSMYTPICLEDYKKPLPPCRSVCERAKAGCAPLMRQYGFPWPDRMRCDSLPVQGAPDTLCMDYNRTDSTTVSPVLSKPTNYPSKAINPNKKKSGRAGVGPKRLNPASRLPVSRADGGGKQRPTPAVQPREDGSDPQLRHALPQPVFHPGRADFHGLLDRTLSVLCFISPSPPSPPFSSTWSGVTGSTVLHLFTCIAVGNSFLSVSLRKVPREPYDS